MCAPPIGKGIRRCGAFRSQRVHDWLNPTVFIIFSKSLYPPVFSTLKPLLNIINRFLKWKLKIFRLTIKEILFLKVRMFLNGGKGPKKPVIYFKVFTFLLQSLYVLILYLYAISI